jgi:hypothetical protein
MKKKIDANELKQYVKSPPESKLYIREGRGFTIRIMPTGSIAYIEYRIREGGKYRIQEALIRHHSELKLAEAREMSISFEK